jgi:hypothetical protein
LIDRKVEALRRLGRQPHCAETESARFFGHAEQISVIDAMLAFSALMLSIGTEKRQVLGSLRMS